MPVQLTTQKTWIGIAAAAFMAVGPCAVSAQAQTVIDVAEITCEQYLTFKVADPKDISIWLSGYFHGRQMDTRLYPQQLGTNFDKLKSECFLLVNSKRKVLEVAEKLFARQK